MDQLELHLLSYPSAEKLQFGAGNRDTEGEPAVSSEPTGSPEGLPHLPCHPRAGGHTHCATRPWQVLTQSQSPGRNAQTPSTIHKVLFTQAPLVQHLHTPPKCLFHAEGNTNKYRSVTLTLSEL